MSALDYIAEGGRVLDAAQAAGFDLRMTGGVAIASICPSANRPPLQRTYVDIDFVGRSRNVEKIEELFFQLGYAPEESFNALHGEFRLFFDDKESGREADVFLDAVRGCHSLDLRDRLCAWPRTISPADLLLSKLQVFETNDKDYLDIMALLADHDISEDDSGVCLPRIVAACSSDWGWWRTVTMVAQRAAEFAERLAAQDTHLNRVPGQLGVIIEALETSPKTFKWKMRARVGERVKWYEEPEELAH